MAMAAGMTEPIDGIADAEPAFDLDVVWIEPARRADMLGYTVVDAASVLDHLAELIRSHAAELVTREEVGRLWNS